MKLKSGRLYWPHVSEPPMCFGSVDRDIECDVLVVGSGVTGAMVAHHLSNEDVRVVVVDRRKISSGSTPASTALLQYEIDTPLTELRSELGSKMADDAYLASYRAVDDLRALARTLDGGCDMVPRQSVYMAVRACDQTRLEAEHHARSAIGIEVELFSRKRLLETFAIDRPCALVSGTALEINPVRLTQKLLHQALRCGVLIHDETTVDLSSIRGEPGRVHLQTDTDHMIHADWVVVATGYETPKQFAEVARLTSIASTFAIATSQSAGEPWPGRALLWEIADPYLYARTTIDGRVIVGGEDVPIRSPAARDRLLSHKTEVLLEKLRELIPTWRGEVEFAWAGSFAQTDDGLPLIGEHPKWPAIPLPAR